MKLTKRKKKGQLSEETIYLYLNRKAWQVYPISNVRLITTSGELARSFDKEVLLVDHKWFDL